MKEQPHYTDVLNKEFFVENYLKKRMSFPKLSKLLKKKGYNISIGTIYNYCLKLGFETRNSSEARREWDENPLDYNITYLTEDIIEAIDGFLLGDGNINYDQKAKRRVARFSCGVEYEIFCIYLINFFKKYNPKILKVNMKKMKQGFIFNAYSKFHPDIYKQYLRWYPKVEGKRIKQPPQNVHITPKSVMMWYLGDGSLVKTKYAVIVRLSTDGFLPEKVEMLVKKLNNKGILCCRTFNNRIRIKTKGIPAFFDFIGRKSPVKCYDYKFDLPDFRFESKRMKDVSDELEIDYNRLSYLVKINEVPCYRMSKKGRPRFLPKHIEVIKEKIKDGELY